MGLASGLGFVPPGVEGEGGTPLGRWPMALPDWSMSASLIALYPCLYSGLGRHVNTIL